MSKEFNEETSPKAKKIASAILAKVRAKHGMKEQFQEEAEQTAGQVKPTHIVPKKDLERHKDWMESEGFDTHVVPAPRKYRKSHVGIVAHSPLEASYHESGHADPIGAEGAYHSMKEQVEDLDECDMLDTSLSDVKPSARGEVYSKTSEKTTAPTKPTGSATHVVGGKTGEAYNTTAITKRMPALEHAIRGVMERSYDIKRIHAESADITIVSPEQREDWMNVERGMMNVVDYFSKYKITGEQ